MVDVISVENAKVEEIQLPEVFKQAVNPATIKKAFLAEESVKFQLKYTDPFINRADLFMLPYLLYPSGIFNSEGSLTIFKTNLLYSTLELKPRRPCCGTVNCTFAMVSAPRLPAFLLDLLA